MIFATHPTRPTRPTCLTRLTRLPCLTCPTRLTYRATNVASFFSAPGDDVRYLSALSTI